MIDEKTIGELKLFKKVMQENKRIIPDSSIFKRFNKLNDLVKSRELAEANLLKLVINHEEEVEKIRREFRCF